MKLNFYLTKDYENQRLRRRGENKPGTNPVAAGPKYTTVIMASLAACIAGVRTPRFDQSVSDVGAHQLS